jgi:D-glycero-D-manno-heptose 1,7-bisphosphate phosphatase
MWPVRQIVILVGGKGTRLGELTLTTPKPLLEIAPSVRFIDLLIREAARQGFSDIILLAGHLGLQFEAAYQGKVIHGAYVRVVQEPAPAGTGGALLFAKDILDPWFVLANGDSFFEINLRRLVAPLAPKSVGRLALRPIANPERYGTVDFNGTTVTQFLEKRAGFQGPAHINAGIYFLSRNVTDEIAGPCSLEHDIFPRLATTSRLEAIVFEGEFLDIGLPETYAQGRNELPRKLSRPAVFFDRDGVLNQDFGYTHLRNDLVWLEGAREAIAMVNNCGWHAFVVTNQSGIARGHYTQADMEAFHYEMQRQLNEVGAYIDQFFWCPYHRDGVIPAYVHADHPERKPNPGMILRAIKEWNVDANSSFLVGDQPSDILAAQRAGIVALQYQGGSLLKLVSSQLRG